MPTLTDRREGALRSRHRPTTPGQPFQSTLEKGVVGGYAPLDESKALVPTGNLALGTPSGATALLGDQTWGPVATPTDVTTAVAAEASLRSAADATLQSDITSEATARASADTTLQTNITAEATTRASADTTEAAARVAGDALALKIASDLADLHSVSTARTNLGLGTAATKNVGTASGTVAAGDDSRFTTKGTWTPVDASGAGLVFGAGTAGTWEKTDRGIVARACVVYPATASALAALIGGLPVASVATNEDQQGFVSYTDESTLYYAVPNVAATTVPLLGKTGGAITNATMSGNTVFFTCIYRDA